jgi:hypothetical protein
MVVLVVPVRPGTPTRFYAAHRFYVPRIGWIDAVETAVGNGTPNEYQTALVPAVHSTN